MVTNSCYPADTYKGDTGNRDTEGLFSETFGLGSWLAKLVLVKASGSLPSMEAEASFPAETGLCSGSLKAPGHPTYKTYIFSFIPSVF